MHVHRIMSTFSLCKQALPLGSYFNREMRLFWVEVTYKRILFFFLCPRNSISGAMKFLPLFMQNRTSLGRKEAKKGEEEQKKDIQKCPCLLPRLYVYICISLLLHLCRHCCCCCFKPISSYGKRGKIYNRAKQRRLFFSIRSDFLHYYTTYVCIPSFYSSKILFILGNWIWGETNFFFALRKRFASLSLSAAVCLLSQKSRKKEKNWPERRLQLWRNLERGFY